MKYAKMGLRALMTTSVLAALVSGCTEEPISIYDADVTGEETPIISLVVPDSNFNAENIVFSGIGVIEITGQNFSIVPDYNLVFFNGEPGVVINSSETNLFVRVPDVAGDSIYIQVATRGAFSFAEYDSPIAITPAVQEIGGFDDLDQLYSLACDETETMWITAFGSRTINILAVEPDSLKKTKFSSLTVASTAFKYGGRDRLFMTGGALLYSMNRVTESLDPSVMLPVAQGDVTKDIDFVDSTLAFMAIIKASVPADNIPSTGFIMSIDLEVNSMDTVAAYDSLGIETVRVFGNDLYVAGSYLVDAVNLPSAVWKNSISGSSLGQRELVVDLADYPEYSNAQITSMTFSSDGKMYLGLNSVTAVVVVENGFLSPFYDPVLSPPTKDLSWGNGDYLYQLKTTRLIKINMVQPGAPYYGRF